MEKGTTATNDTSSYPGAFGLFKPSSEAIKRAFGPLAVIFGVLFGIGVILGIMIGVLNLPKDVSNNLSNLINLIASLFTTPMFAFIILSATRGARKEVGEAFNYAKANLLRFFVANLLVGLVVIGGLLLLVIPGIIFALKLSMTNYILVDNPQMSGLDAFKGSWAMTRGQLGKLLGIIGVGFIMLLPMVTIVGIIATVILLVLYSAAVPVLYNYLLSIGQPVKLPDTSHPSVPKAPAAV